MKHATNEQTNNNMRTKNAFVAGPKPLHHHYPHKGRKEEKKEKIVRKASEKYSFQVSLPGSPLLVVGASGFLKLPKFQLVP